MAMHQGRYGNADYADADSKTACFFVSTYARKRALSTHIINFLGVRLLFNHAKTSDCHLLTLIPLPLYHCIYHLHHEVCTSHIKQMRHLLAIPHDPGRLALHVPGKSNVTTFLHDLHVHSTV